MKAWRLAYLDEDFGVRYVWAPDKRTAERTLKPAIIEHYRKGGYVPEVLGPAVVYLPINTRGGQEAMIDWLNANLTRPAGISDRAPRRPNDEQPSSTSELLDSMPLPPPGSPFIPDLNTQRERHEADLRIQRRRKALGQRLVAHPNHRGKQ